MTGKNEPGHRVEQPEGPGEEQRVETQAPAGLTAGTRPRRAGWGPLLLVLSATLGCLVPFLNKAYHIDDTLFLFAARHIRENPANFYGFQVNWYGTAAPMDAVMQNPPANAYWIAAVSWLIGWREVFMHTAFLLPALAVAAGTYRLARRLCKVDHWIPAVGALCAVLTPAFIVSATNIMADVMMLALYVWAVVFWIEGLESDSTGYLLAASALVAAASLTKYFGISLFLLLGVYAWRFHYQRASMAMAFLFLPLLIVGGYEVYGFSLYNHGMIFGAADYAQGMPALVGSLWQRLCAGLSFAGGAIPGAIFLVPWLWPRRGWWVVGLCFAAAGAFAPLFGKLVLPEVKSPLATFEFVVFVGCGLHLLTLVVAEFWTRKDAYSFLLLCWALGTFAFATVFNWTVSVRALLPLAPAFGVLIARRLSARRPSPVGLAILLSASAAVSLMVAGADYAWAGSMRTMAARLCSLYKSPNNTVWFQGHWGFQYYMEAAGGKDLDRQSPFLKPGDVIINPLDNCNMGKPQGATLQMEARYPVAPCRWLASANTLVGAGFYTSILAPIPYYVGPVPELPYEVLRFK